MSGHTAGGPARTVAERPVPQKARSRHLRLPLGGPRLRRLVRERPLSVPPATRRNVELVVFVAIAVLLLTFFRPELLLSATTPTGGDTGAHVYTPWYLKTRLLPRGLISGWSPDWYAGFPVLHFYFPFVITLQALMAHVMPYEVAFKLGTVLGTFFFPVSVYLLLRLVGFRFPTPILGAVLSLGFLFMDSFQIYGGNIPSTLAGEYSFSLGLGLSLVFLGLVYRVVTGDGGRPLLSAGVLAVAALSHLVPVIIVVLTTPLLFFWSLRHHGVYAGIRRLAVVFGLAFALTAFWSVPFLVRLGYSADMHWFPLDGWGPVAPRELWAFLAAALLAVIVAALRRDERILVVLVPAALGLLLYVVVSPGRLFDGRVWNGRFLPFWYIGVFLSSAYLVGTVTPTIARFISRGRAGGVALGVVVAVGAATFAGVLRDRQPSYIDNWIDHNYRGYEATAAFPTFRALMDRVERLPHGRVMWEPSPDLVEFGTPVALMTLPYWTGQPTIEGINFESSITTPFHFVTASEIAEQPSNPIPLLPYHEFDMSRGLQHMRLLDVSYFVSVSQKARQAASQTPGLTLIDDIGRYSLFAVDSPGQVVVPRYEPVVLPEGDWIDENLSWFASMTELEVPLVRDGPDDWARVGSSAAPLPREPVDDGGRSFPAVMGDDEIRFTTDAIGRPHWVKTSFFPNWRVEGALGPYLASPSMMMVVPTQAEVRLRYERTWVEWVGLSATFAALGALVVPRLRRRVLAVVSP